MIDDDSPQRAPLSSEEEAFLRALARVVLYVPRVFESDLGKHEGFATSEYFALMHLSEAPGGRLTMGELASFTALSLGAVTRVVKVLESKGLVERHKSATDGRSSEAVMTDAGYARLEQVRPTHLASARRRIFDQLEGLNLRTATQALERIGQGDAADAAGPGTRSRR